jgi:hypothetical protein
MPLSPHEIRTIAIIGVVIAGVAYVLADQLLGFAAFFVVPGVAAPFVLYELRRGRGQEQEAAQPSHGPQPV